MSEICKSTRWMKLLTWTLVIFGCVLGHAQVSTGTIQGTVEDASQSVIVGAKVTVTNSGTGITQTVVTDSRGRYLIPDLQVGVYKVEARSQGFQTKIVSNQNVTVGTTSTVDVVLPVGQSNQTVSVEANQEQVERSTSDVSSLVDRKQISSLPLNGRDFQQLVLLAPGVELNTSQPTDATHGRSLGYSVNGQRAEGQYFLLDGTLIQNFWNNGAGNALVGTSLGVEAIGEFTILTDTYGAQYGGSGAAINQVTRSGTNTFHGSAYDYLRNSAFDARNYFDPVSGGPPAFRRNQFGGSVGGPIRKDKAFFFVNYEGLRQLLELDPIRTVPDLLARGNAPGDPPGQACVPVAGVLTCYPITALQAATLAQYAPPNLADNGNGTAQSQVFGGETVHEDYINTRVDYTLSPKDTFFARVVNDNALQYDPFPTSVGYPETGNGHNVYATGEYRRTVSPNFINLARFGFTRTKMNTEPLYIPSSTLQYYPGLQRVGDLAITPNSTLGIDGNTPITWIQNRFIYSDDIVMTKGAHNIRAGIDIIRFQTNNHTQLSLAGSYTFLSLSAFYLNQQCPAAQVATCTTGPSSFSGSIPGSNDSQRAYREIDVWPYFQDDWKISSKFTLNYGVRYDFTTNPVEAKNKLHEIIDPLTSTGYSPITHAYSANASLKNIEPRLGFAYSPFASGKTSIRAGFGIYDNVITPTQYSLGFDANPPYFYGSQVNPAPFPVAFSQITGPINTPYATAQPLALAYQGIKTPYLTTYNLNVQEQLSSGSVLTIAYIGSKGTHNFMLRDNNPAVPTYVNGQIFFANSTVRVNPKLQEVNFEVPTGTSHFDSGQLTYNLTSHSLRGQLAYTYSHCLDTGSQVNQTPEASGSVEQINPFDITNEYSRCNYDVRHNVTANGVADLPFHGNLLVSGWQLNSIFQVRTGPAFTANDGYTNSNDGNFAFGMDRPNLVPGRNDNPILHQVHRWFDPTAFVLQPHGFLGNVKRNTLTGPGIVELDSGLQKSTPFTKISETFAMVLRADFFNVLNHPNFQNPNPSLYVASTSTTAPGYINGGVPNPLAGNITSTTTTARQIQVSVKFIF